MTGYFVVGRQDDMMFSGFFEATDQDAALAGLKVQCKLVGDFVDRRVVSIDDFPQATKAPNDAPMVVQERSEKYGGAWLLTGELLTWLADRGLLDRLLNTPYAYNWIIAFNKLIRALASPTEPDHWKDLEGYAYLVRKDLTP